VLLVVWMVALMALALAIPLGRDFYALELPPEAVLVEAGLIAVGAAALMEVGWRFRGVAVAAGQRLNHRRRANGARVR
jgi:hypothetical protein